MKKNNKAPRVAIWTMLGLILIAGIAYAFDLYVSQGRVPRGTSVGGVNISSMEPAQAVKALESELGGVENRPVTVTAGDLRSTFVPAEAGLKLNYQAAVEGIGSQPLNPITRVVSFFAAPTEIPVAVDVDQLSMDNALAKVEQDLAKPAADGALMIENGQFKVAEPVLGQMVQRQALNQAVVDQWLNPNGVKVEPVVVEPAINSEAIERMRTGEAETALGSDIVVHGEKNVTATLDRAAIGQFVSVSNRDGQLVLNVDNAKAREVLAERLAESETPAVNAKLRLSGGSRQVTPSQDGYVVDWDKTLEGFENRVKSKDQRTFNAVYKHEPATFTTEMAQTASFDQVVGEFTTGGFSGPSGENIRLTAAIVDGAIVGPGETFSLNNYTGPRGAAQGFVESGIIIDGHAGKAVGGGISQFATTLYNAAYFAGMQDVTHTPHSYYISRYPAGREATVFEGAIDLQFKNTSNYPVRIDTYFDGSTITVKLMGVKTVNVTSTNNGRWATTQPQAKTVTEDCSPSSGAPGFTTSDTRTITDLAGNVISQETQTTVYDPQPIVRCS